MKLYTRTVCGKCMWIKSEIEAVGLVVEIVNMDHNAAAKEEAVAQGFMTAPILRDGDIWYGTIDAILERLQQEAA